jgi:glycosyltransferase involved in cell wall biosynthesis
MSEVIRAIELSIILPTINEGENIRNLIPELFKTLGQHVNGLEVIVVDDGSTDSTRFVVAELSARYQSVSAIFRSSSEKSLSGSIQTGIDAAVGELVVWMDADGSMTSDVVVNLLKAWKLTPQNEATVVIASRFVAGGGLKGSDTAGSTPLHKVIRNLHLSEDSLFAVFLSWILNRTLSLVLDRCCVDVTSGFILAPKSVLSSHRLSGIYGDYFPRLMYKMHKNGIKIVEIPYTILVRTNGESKTGTTVIQILRSGVPYLKVFWVPFSTRLSRD